MSNPYRITRVRLVNFHNLGTTTIEIRSGGHLFLLGDNGSGKTTILDAIHFALTGGREMEFNAAARVVGARSGSGRNVQGVIMRYNIETGGPLNPGGGITYAALQLEPASGRKLSIVTGASARGMDEAYESWGAVREGGVDELPLVEEENGRLRPATRHELRDSLNRHGYYGRIGAYTDEVARRLFGGREAYEDACQLLATGKAYREIAARAGDYDRLFRTLLQEPPRETFDELIRNLVSIEDSRRMLDTLRGRMDFINSLSRRRDRIEELRVDIASARLLREQMRIEANNRAARESAARRAEQRRRLALLDIAIEDLRQSQETAGMRLAELRNRDSGGILAREKEARITLDKAKTRYNRSLEAFNTAGKVFEMATSESRKAADALTGQMRASMTELQRIGRSLTFSTVELAGFLDDAARGEAPEAAIPRLPVAGIAQRAAAERESLASRRANLAAALRELEESDRSLEDALEDLRRREEAQPLIADFDAAYKTLLSSMLRARPLYEGLVPAPGLRAREIAMLEQIIGDHILGTWVVGPDDADSLRQTLFSRFPAHSIGVAKEDSTAGCHWLGRYFDIAASDPDSLQILGRQLLAKDGPEMRKFLEYPILHFRGRETPAEEKAPRLIGQEARRREQERQIKELEKKLDECRRDQRNLKRELEKIDEARTALESLDKILSSLPGTLGELAYQLRDAREKAGSSEKSLEHARADLIRGEEERNEAAERREDLLIRLKSEGLEGIEARIRTAENKHRALVRESGEKEREAGALEHESRKLSEEIRLLEEQNLRLGEQRDKAEKQLLDLAKDEPSPLAFATGRCERFARTTESLTEFERERESEAVRGETEMEHSLRADDNTALGFHYERAGNTLRDRRGAEITTVAEEAAESLREQESLFTEETRHLFRQIIMNRLVVALQTGVMQMQEMTRRISSLMRDRFFGNNRYTFSATPVDGYRHLIETLRNYHTLAPDRSEADLKAFIDAHLDEIINTEPGDIPAVLDYRNWFRYELRIRTRDDGGRIIDRHTKSLGSGGEQAVPNYLLVLMIASFLFERGGIRLPILIFDEAFYGIDTGRRDQIVSFATDLGLQLFVASPDQDGVKRDVPQSTSILVIKDDSYNVHLYPVHWDSTLKQQDILDPLPDFDPSPDFPENAIGSDLR